MANTSPALMTEILDKVATTTKLAVTIIASTPPYVIALTNVKSVVIFDKPIVIVCMSL